MDGLSFEVVVVCHCYHNYLRVLIVKANFAVGTLLKRIFYLLHVSLDIRSSTIRHKHLLYILESNPHPFYSFRGLKNHMRIRIACRLDCGRELDFEKMIEPPYVP